MTAEITITYAGRRFRLTCDHPMSSYGRPVLVDENGKAYGEADVVIPSEPALVGTYEPVTGAAIVGYSDGDDAEALGLYEPTDEARRAWLERRKFRDRFFVRRTEASRIEA